MSRIAALNDEEKTQLSSTDDGQQVITREAEEAAAHRRYNEALQLQAAGDDDGADRLFLAVLASPAVAETAEPFASGMGRLLRYSCHKNLGSAALRRGDPKTALTSLLAAAELDDTDVSLWYKTGVAAYRADRLHLARAAFKQGLACSPGHWPCMDSLVSVLYLLSDFEECLLRLSAAFRRDPHFTKGRALVDLMLKEQPSLADAMKPFLPDGDTALSGAPYDAAAGARLTEEQLGSSLLALYQHVVKPGADLSLLAPVDLEAALAGLRRGDTVRPAESAARPDGRRVTFEDEDRARRRLAWDEDAPLRSAMDTVEGSVEEAAPALITVKSSATDTVEGSVEEAAPALITVEGSAMDTVESSVEETAPALITVERSATDTVEGSVEEAAPALITVEGSAMDTVESSVEETAPALITVERSAVDTMQHSAMEVEPAVDAVERLAMEVSPEVDAVEQLAVEVAPAVDAVERLVMGTVECSAAEGSDVMEAMDAEGAGVVDGADAGQAVEKDVVSRSADGTHADHMDVDMAEDDEAREDGLSGWEPGSDQESDLFSGEDAHQEADQGWQRRPEPSDTRHAHQEPGGSQDSGPGPRRDHGTVQVAGQENVPGAALDEEHGAAQRRLESDEERTEAAKSDASCGETRGDTVHHPARTEACKNDDSDWKAGGDQEKDQVASVDDVTGQENPAAEQRAPEDRQPGPDAGASPEEDVHQAMEQGEPEHSAARRLECGGEEAGEVQGPKAGDIHGSFTRVKRMSTRKLLKASQEMDDDQEAREDRISGQEEDQEAADDSGAGQEAGSELTSDATVEPDAASRRPVKRKRSILDSLKMWPRNDPAEKRRSKRARTAGGLRCDEPVPGEEIVNYRELFSALVPSALRFDRATMKLDVTPEEARELRGDALVTLLYAELLVDRAMAEGSGAGAELEQAEDELAMLGFAVLREDVLGAQQPALQELHELLTRTPAERRPTLRLPYCACEPLVSADAVQRQLTMLQRVRDLDGVQRLYDEQRLEEVVDVLLVMLVDALERLGRLGELAVYAEASLHESLQAYLALDEPTERMRWTKALVRACAALRGCSERGHDWAERLEAPRRCRLAENMLHLVVHQLNSFDVLILPLETVEPWLLLHHAIVRYERPAGGGARPRQMPVSLRFLVSAHEALGARSWCCTDGGALLHRCADKLLAALDVADDLPYDEQVRRALEQCFFCLYGHPPQRRGRPRHLQEHDVPPVTLTWSRAAQMYYYFCPCELPLFDSPREASISADDEVLFQRVMALVPAESSPDALADQMERHVTEPEASRPPPPPPVPATSVTKNLYYLVADFNFKHRQWDSIEPQLASLPYYVRDLCINPERRDSWAAMALARASQVERELNLCEEPRADTARLWQRVEAAVRCYQRALHIDPQLHKLWLEFGTFSYMLSSHANRLLRQDSSSDLDLATFSLLESAAERLSGQARLCFTEAETIAVADAAQGEACDDRWLHHYMLGKMAGRDGQPVDRVLAHYQKAHELLQQTGVVCPRKINYQDPPYLVLEALEVYYRVHATVLKHLLRHEQEPLAAELRRAIVWHLDTMQRSCWAFQPDQERTGEKRPHSALDGEQPAEVKRLRRDEAATRCAIVLSDRILSEAVLEARTRLSGGCATDAGTAGPACAAAGAPPADEEPDTATLVRRCLAALHGVVRRFPEHYKSVYRLAHYYFISKRARRVEWARDLLLGCHNWPAKEHMPTAGLFADRKDTNFFNGIWRFPVDDVDRPGSFAAHMYRSVSLLVDVLKATDDFQTLLQLAGWLRTSPEASKKYLRDKDREQLAGHAFKMGLQCARATYQRLFKAQAPVPGVKRFYFLMQLHEAYTGASRARRPLIAPLLEKTFKQYRGGKVDAEPPLLQQAIKFCEEGKAAMERKRMEKAQASTSAAVARGSVEAEQLLRRAQSTGLTLEQAWAGQLGARPFQADVDATYRRLLQLQRAAQPPPPDSSAAAKAPATAKPAAAAKPTAAAKPADEARQTTAPLSAAASSGADLSVLAALSHAGLTITMVAGGLRRLPGSLTVTAKPAGRALPANISITPPVVSLQKLSPSALPARPRLPAAASSHGQWSASVTPRAPQASAPPQRPQKSAQRAPPPPAPMRSRPSFSASLQSSQAVSVGVDSLPASISVTALPLPSC
ncbi:calcineurin-binding protein cabin-1-like [Pollicipes pollicipes]|uniref:calcineurin-binding protein cabin-1-like n=1 Tax=Pollicipes pollicipes TaxID=41117 RepID=UPI00188516B3|nr:calcineurin-binding protein cabin-1-like [Pollicipes pollicipes]